ILPDSELAELGTLFTDRYFGELIFLVQEGVLIVPSHMGERPITAMHGYHPNEKHSFAALCTNRTIPEEVTAIPDVFKLMTSEAEEAFARNFPSQAERRLQPALPVGPVPSPRDQLPHNQPRQEQPHETHR